MKITYIDHSGFAVEFPELLLLFDYDKGKLPVWDAAKPLFVFASHSHPDHFNWQILRLYEQYPHIFYLFGNDIRLGKKWMAQRGIDEAVRQRIRRLAGGRTVEVSAGDAKIRVHTLTSTDAGVAFVVETQGKRIYHSGDLNWWHWESGDLQEAEANEAMKKAYREQIRRLDGMYFDVAFVPLDPRLGNSYDWGINEFLEKTDCPMVFPMHLWGQYDTVSRYLQEPKNRKYAHRIAAVKRGGQEWNI